MQAEAAVSALPSGLPAMQQPAWPDRRVLDAVTARLRRMPALVTAAECDRLREHLAAAQDGHALVLQGGPCAETFNADQRLVARATATLRQMATVIEMATGRPVVRLGRMAGQYAKPRSSPVETRDGVELPVYRGDAVNGLAFTEAARTPDPNRLERAYHESAATLRVMGDECHVSHEALLLDYETALSRTDPETGRDYAGSGHLLWIGERTRRPDGAHVAFAAGISNPVAVKLGPSVTTDDVLTLIESINPANEPGRLTLIPRLGAGRVRDILGPLMEKVTASGARVLWVCDPMHGNTWTTGSGVKTRHFADIAAEVGDFIGVCRELGIHPGGFHLELTGDHVTECLGGTDQLTPADLAGRYESACDPRLNRSQALDLAFEIAELWRSTP